MFKRFVMTGLGLLMAAPAMAQVKVELLLDQQQYLLKETLMVGVRVINHSGQTLNLAGDGWLSLIVEDREKFAVKRIADTTAPQPISIETTFMATQWIDIGRAFEFRENSRYSLRARVRIEQWSEEVFSPPIEFEIIKGTKLWEQQVGIPTAPGQQPDIRKYILQQANYLKELQLYARVTDVTEQKVFSVIRLAPMVQVSQPEAQIDTLNRLHVLIQVGMKIFLHVCLDPDGKMVLRNSYEITTARPGLKVSPAGGVYVNGGQRLLRWDDIPPSEVLSRPEPATPAVTPPSVAPEAASGLPAVADE
jgi:hypothetical protein